MSRTSPSAAGSSTLSPTTVFFTAADTGTVTRSVRRSSSMPPVSSASRMGSVAGP